MTSGLAITPGRSWPLGSSWDGEGVNFALFSAHAERVELCLFDAAGDREIARLALPEYTDEVWHGHVDGLAPGQLYGLRVHGPHAPHEGHRFNPAKLLVDPYARELNQPFVWHESLHDNDQDSAAVTPKCRVVADDGRAPAGSLRTPLQESIVYDLHVRGFTKLHQAVPEAERGTFAGLAAPAVVEHLSRLGVSAVELLPVQAFATEPHLAAHGLVNYWGYNPVTPFAPEPRYLAAGRDEIRSAVARLHEAGIEVLLDVVYNHTGEGDAAGPILCLRGIDNRSYYRLDDEGRYLNDSGCGNTLDLGHPRVLQLVMASLRHWVEAYGIDGFRFDLATTLARGPEGFDTHAPFLAAIGQDPVLSTVKLIAEPWDLGPGGYRLGDFPPGWSEWNDRYRDTVRRFWRGDPGVRGELRLRLAGSPDLFDRRGRRPSASINYVTAHDGFTLTDLVSYARKHNEANGEDNRDGTDSNFSANWGVEGPTDDAAILRLRERVRRNMIATLLLSAGVPMLTAGDELGHSHGGNNNPYCQDNPLTWLDWSGGGSRFLAFLRTLIALRRSHPALCRDRFCDDANDVLWLDTTGRELAETDWDDGEARTLGMRLGCEPGRSLLVLFNAGSEAARFRLPELSTGPGWRLLCDTFASPDPAAAGPLSRPGERYELGAHALALFEAVAP